MTAGNTSAFAGYFQVGVGVFNCQEILTKTSFVVFNIKNKSNVV